MLFFQYITHYKAPTYRIVPLTYQAKPIPIEYQYAIHLVLTSKQPLTTAPPPFTQDQLPYLNKQRDTYAKLYIYNS